jgi:hypothetical protein
MCECWRRLQALADIAPGTSLARSGPGTVIIIFCAAHTAAIATALGLSQAPLALAQQADWITRCRLVLADDSKPESGRYMFLSLGKAAGADARAEFNYNTGISAGGVTYPSEAKYLLNPYSNVSMSVTYVAARDGKTKPAIGSISFRAIGLNFKPISAPDRQTGCRRRTLGRSKPTLPRSAPACIPLDTAGTDGRKLPTLSLADFVKLATAVDEIRDCLVRDRKTLRTPHSSAELHGLARRAAGRTAKTNPGLSRTRAPAAAKC